MKSRKKRAQSVCDSPIYLYPITFLGFKKKYLYFFQMNIYSVIKKHQLNGMNLILICIYQINCLSSVESDMNQNRRKHYPY